MKYLPTLCLFCILSSCNGQKKKLKNMVDQKPLTNTIDNLFELNIIENENFVRIKAGKELDFHLPDSSSKTEPYKYGDFNADGKDDIMIYLGACGTGGCMYGLFLNQYDNYYKLVFMDYLKGAEFEKEKNGLLSIKSYEEVEPYNPSKLYVTKYKFDKKKYQYKMDTTFVSSSDK